MAIPEYKNGHLEEIAAWSQILQIVGNSTLVCLSFDTHDSPGAVFVLKWEFFSPNVPVCLYEVESQMIKVQMKHRLRMDLHKTSSPHISIARLFWISSGNWNNFFIFKSAKLSAGRTSKVENILKGSLDLIPSPSPSVKIQIMTGKVCLRQRRNIAGGCQQTFENKRIADITQHFFALLSQVNFPTNYFNFHWRWRRWDQI